MDLPVNHFKSMLREGRTIFGAWLMSGTPATAEALGCAGFDFLVVDMEHVPVDTPQMIDILRALAGTPAPGVVRLPWNDMVMIKRALDGGAQTVMLPFVQNADWIAIGSDMSFMVGRGEEWLAKAKVLPPAAALMAQGAY